MSVLGTILEIQVKIHTVKEDRVSFKRRHLKIFTVFPLYYMSHLNLSF